MRKTFPDTFERDQGCTETEWLRWLPEAVHGHALQRPAPDVATVTVGAGRLTLRWRELPPRQIALIRLPRMQVDYRFEGVEPVDRDEFMRVFDLHIQRGGG
jgi:hypothetical protein